jgi:hypothetical protein
VNGYLVGHEPSQAEAGGMGEGDRAEIVPIEGYTARAGLKFNLKLAPTPTLIRRARKIAAIPRGRKAAASTFSR